jgi:hypothetical protein
MRPGETLAGLSALCTLLGTYIFAFFGTTGTVGSGIGFLQNISSIINDAWTTISDLNVFPAFYFLVVVFLGFSLVVGFFQLIGIKSRFLMFFFSLIPLSLGVILFVLKVTPLLQNATELYTVFLEANQYGDIFPFLIPIGEIALGTYLVLAGGILGFISVFIPRRKKR